MKVRYEDDKMIVSASEAFCGECLKRQAATYVKWLATEIQRRL